MLTGINALIARQWKRTGLLYTAADSAPETFETLHTQVGKRDLRVWAGASDNTIYRDPSVNHMFRAWHDSLHLKLNAPFNLDGELAVAREQARLMESDIGSAIIMAEVAGQAEHYALTGAFPADQETFIREYLSRKGIKV